MEHTIDAPPQAERYPSSNKLGDMVQAGRSTTSLNAERNAQEIQNESPAISSLISMAEEAPILSEPPHDTASPEEIISRNVSAVSLGRRSSYAPIKPSLLNTSSSSASVNSTKSGGDHGSSKASGESAGSEEVEHAEGEAPVRHRSRIQTSPRGPTRAPLTTIQQPLRQNGIPARQPMHPETEYEGTGDTYSRYPVPYQALRRDPKVPVNSTSSTANLLQNRASFASLGSANPFNDPASPAGSEKWASTYDVSGFNPYSGQEKGLILYRDEIEDDDDDHMPKDDDDEKFKTRFRDHFHRRSAVSTVGGIFLVLGLLTIFIILPILFFTGSAHIPLPGADYSWSPEEGLTWATVNDRKYPLLTNIRTGLIDPDTPNTAMTRKSTFDGSDLKLVFSDEFNRPNRTFYPGDDPYWTAPDFWYGATQDMDWYDPDAVTTWGGTLQLRLDRFDNHNLQYRSGMLNSWNQLCFKGGVFEISLSLPGPAGVPGLWPGAWTMGNLGRPGYKATTEGLWPYTYNSCDVGITPNQSSPDGLSHLPGQKLPSCTCPGEDHPSPGTGRGAPEIDILEASVDPTNFLGVVTQSYQVAPFDVYYRPNSDFLEIPNYNTTSMNGYCGGPFQQAISGTTVLNYDWYDGTAYQKYAFEYVPGTSEGKIAWFVGEDPSFVMDGRAIGQNGNVAPRVVSEEPMSMVLNLGFSTAWGMILLDKLRFPTVMRVDYVRIYQRPGHESVTCDPPGYPTTEYIKKHAVAYNNPNLTAWNDTGYPWPRNHMQFDC